MSDAPIDAAVDHRYFYYVVSASHSTNQAAIDFKARYGYPPRDVIFDHGVWWLGPVFETVQPEGGINA